MFTTIKSMSHKSPFVSGYIFLLNLRTCLVFATFSQETKRSLFSVCHYKYHIHYANIVALFSPRTCAVDVAFLCNKKRAEMIITKGLSWESSFGSKAGCSSNENCRSYACQSMARAARRLPRVLVAVSSAHITIPA